METYTARDNDNKQGGDFHNYNEYTVSLAETYEENDDIVLEILKIKISKHFNQIYGDQNKTKIDPKVSVSKAYHWYLNLFSKKASERYPQSTTYNPKIHLYPKFKQIR